jgi:hypothetical protein
MGITTSELEPVEVGKFPYPYEAAFTVSSDIDGSSLARYRAVHALFCGMDTVRPNTDEWRDLGLNERCAWFDATRGGVPGMGLEVSDSFFLIADEKAFGMYRYLPGNDFFQEDEQGGENCNTLIRQWIKARRVDAYHAFLHFKRDQVEPMLKDFHRWCEEENVAKPTVWTNHSYAVTPTGLCPAALQPARTQRLLRLSARGLLGPLLGRKRFPLRHAFARYQGDWPGSPYYVNDLLAASGLRYVWLNMDDLYRDRIALPEESQNGRATILQPLTMSDGVRYYRFSRCYGKADGRPGGESYLRNSKDGFDSSAIITDPNLEALCRAAGTCILYTHWTHARSLPIADETIARFRVLQRWRDAGRIWVTSLSQLLEWTRRRTFLRFTCRRESQRLVLEIEGVDDPIFGREQIPARDLNGICFVLRQALKRLTVVVNGQALDDDQVHYAGTRCWLATQ